MGSDALQVREVRFLMALLGASMFALIVAAQYDSGREEEGATVEQPPPPAETVAGLSPEQAFVGGWIPYYHFGQGTRSFRRNIDVFDDVSVFGYTIEGRGQIVGHLSADKVQRVLSLARERGVTVYATVFDQSPRGVVARVLADPGSRARHIDELLGIVSRHGYDGIDIDYEQFAFADGVSSWSSTRRTWVTFIRELGSALRAEGKLLAVATPPIFNSDRTGSSGYWVYDWASIAADVDQVRIMAYDYSTSQPGPIAPMPWVRKGLDYALQVLPPEKVRLGVPSYGRAWTTDSSGACPSTWLRMSNPTAATALARAAEKGAPVRFDRENAEAYFRYKDRRGFCTIVRRVSVSEARSVAAKAELALDRGVGITLWSVGNEDQAQWDALRVTANAAP